MLPAYAMGIGGHTAALDIQPDEELATVDRGTTSGIDPGRQQPRRRGPQGLANPTTRPALVMLYGPTP
jgi:hypothetical protein